MSRTCGRQIALVVEHVVDVGPEQPEAGGAAGLKHERGNPEASAGVLRGGEGGVEDEARQPRCPLLCEERRERVADVARGLHGGVQGEELGDAAVVRRGRHGLRDDVRHGDEGDPGRVARGVRRVERRVEDGDGEPPRVQRAGEVQHRAEVALERQWAQHDASAAGWSWSWSWSWTVPSGHC